MHFHDSDGNMMNSDGGANLSVSVVTLTFKKKYVMKDCKLELRQ